MLPVHFAACAESSLEQIKSGLWPTHLFRQITGAVTAYSYDGTKSSANLMIHGFWGEFNGFNAIVVNIEEEVRGLKRLSLLAIGLTTVIAGFSSAQTAAKQPVIEVQKPSIVAFYAPVSGSDAEKPEEIESLSDFRLSVEGARKSLRAAGIELHEVYSTSFRIRIGAKTTSFHPTEDGVGYYLIAPGKQPSVEYGVMTDVDLLHVAKQYFGSAKLPN